MAGKTKKEKYDKIKDKKVSTSIDQLTKGFPTEINQYMTYCRNLKFEERPDYAHCRKLLQTVFSKNGYEHDDQYDWVIKKH
jgi:casein kinase 1